MAKKFSGRYSLNDIARLSTVGKSSEKTVWQRTDKPPYVDALVVGGGGAGGGTGGGPWSGGGGGAGGFRQSQVLITPGITYDILVGSGGTGSDDTGAFGTPSQFGPLVSNGGGGGGGYNAPGRHGGSWGGCNGGASEPSAVCTPSYPGTTFNTDQGFHGQRGQWPGNRGGGGGGSYQLQDSNWYTYSNSGHAGGASYITGQYVLYGAGGGAGDTSGYTGLNNGGALGLNGGQRGGDGGTTGSNNGTAGPPNTGSGGGGCFGNSGSPTRAGGNGGSGIVIIRYPDLYGDPVSVTGTYNTANTGNGFKVYTWLSSGSVTF
jgi:hypothetical protein